MALITLNTTPNRRELRLFGLLLPLFTVAAGVVVARMHSSFAARLIWWIGAAVTLVFVAVPRARRPLFVAWNGLMYPIGWAVSAAIMAVVFYGVVTPIGVIARLLGHDGLHRRLNRSAASYWVSREPQRDVQRYFRQF